MTKHIASLPDPDGSLLLRELNHRVNNELTSAICTVSAKAVKSDDAEVKAALLDVVDLLHGYADFTRLYACRIVGSSPTPQGTSSIFASPSRNTDWTG